MLVLSNFFCKIDMTLSAFPLIAFLKKLFKQLKNSMSSHRLIILWSNAIIPIFTFSLCLLSINGLIFIIIEKFARIPWGGKMSLSFFHNFISIFRILGAFSERRQSNLKQFRKRKRTISEKFSKNDKFSLNYVELLWIFSPF